MTSETLLRFGQFLLAAALFGGVFYVWYLKMRHWEHYGVGHFGDGAAEKTNCPDCGARVPAAPEQCEYCGKPLPDSDEDGRAVRTDPERSRS